MAVCNTRCSVTPLMHSLIITVHLSSISFGGENCYIVLHYSEAYRTTYAHSQPLNQIDGENRILFLFSMILHGDNQDIGGCRLVDPEAVSNVAETGKHRSTNKNLPRSYFAPGVRSKIMLGTMASVFIRRLSRRNISQVPGANQNTT